MYGMSKVQIWTLTVYFCQADQLASVYLFSIESD